jgi:hypothetical protein
MNKSTAYLIPVIVLAAAYGLSVFVNNQIILFAGLLVSLIWFNRVATTFQDKAIKILTMIAIIVIAIWAVGLLMWGLSF